MSLRLRNLVRTSLPLASALGTLSTVITLAMVAGCTDIPGLSKTNDVFTQDQGDANSGNDRRRPASAAEDLWTIYVKNAEGWCTGHLIAPEIMMTAGHCNPQVGDQALSGSAIAAGNKTSDIQVASVLEIDHNLDYSIVQITWANGYPTTQKFPPKVATKASDVSTSESANQGDAVFTVGFPQDLIQTWGATFSQGNLKATQDSLMYYNIGTINGNSGGGVWRSSDFMLVSLTNGGAFNVGQAGWNSNSADNPSTWNTGPTMWDVYAASQTLQDTFPNGTNRYAGAATPGGSSSIWMLLGAADVSVTNGYTLYISAPAATKSVVFCTGTSAAACNANSQGYTTTTLVKTIGNQAVFQAARSTALATTLNLAVNAMDGQSNSLATSVVTFAQPY